MKVPTVLQAEDILMQAESMNSGPWTAHNKVAGRNARKIAGACKNLIPDTAYVLGLLHDIGRISGAMDMRHIIEGFRYMQEQGFDDSARICLTHSFPYKSIEAYNGENDCSREESEFIQQFIDNIEYDDYDRLIQLCDAISFPSGAVFIEKRLVDVVLRKGFNHLTIDKWKAFLSLKDYFDEKTGCDIYKLLGATVII